MSEIKYATTRPNAPQQQDAFNGIVIRLNPDINQGIDKNERIGNKIKFKYCQFRFSFALIRSNVNPPPALFVCRLLLVQLRLLPPGGLIPGPVLADVFIDATTPDQAIHSSINNDMVRVIMDRTYCVQNLDMDPNVANANMPTLIYVKKKWRQSNHCLFRSVTQITPQDPKDNFYFLMLTNANGNGDATIFYNYGFRLSYIDL